MITRREELSRRVKFQVREVNQILYNNGISIRIYLSVMAGYSVSRLILNLHCCSFPCSVMTQEGCYLPLVEVKVEILQSHFAIRVDLVKVINGDSCNHYTGLQSYLSF